MIRACLTLRQKVIYLAKSLLWVSDQCQWYVLMYVYFRKRTSQWTTKYFMFTSGFEQITCHQQYVITCWAYEVSLKNLHIRLFKWLLINVPVHVYVWTCFIIKLLLNDRFSPMHIYCILSKYSYITVHLLHHVHGNVVCEDHKVHNILRKYGLI